MDNPRSTRHQSPATIALRSRRIALHLLILMFIIMSRCKRGVTMDCLFALQTAFFCLPAAGVLAAAAAPQNILAATQDAPPPLTSLDDALCTGHLLRDATACSRGVLPTSPRVVGK